jgi:hypothetical protein
MKVATLISKLKKCPPDAEVFIQIPAHKNSLYEPRHTELVTDMRSSAGAMVQIRTQRREGD